MLRRGASVRHHECLTNHRNRCELRARPPHLVGVGRLGESGSRSSNIMVERKTKLIPVGGDITQLEVDVIVNAANAGCRA